MKPQDITNEMFDKELINILNKQDITCIIAIPGIYEILAEYYNNDVIHNLMYEDWKDNK